MVPSPAATNILTWFVLGAPLVKSRLLTSSRIRSRIMGIFGAKIGKGVIARHGIKIKYPWHLSIGNDCWIGEDCWLDSLAPISIGNDVCISQGAYLCTGNHDWSDPAFGLIVKGITIRDGAWVGAKCLIGPGVEMGECAVAGAGSVVTKNIPPFEIHNGNPASFQRLRRVGPAERSLSTQ
jgi:putative colanic acid biosynthesis acetyltransferase WcaF